MGILAAAIDIISDWLGDLKEGFCKPTFYLNRGFCCWGISGSPLSSSLRLMIEQEYCSDWNTWATALNVTSKAGGYVVSYIFYILFAVGLFFKLQKLIEDFVWWSCKFASCVVCTICKTQWNPRNKNDVRRLRYSSIYRNMGSSHKISGTGISFILIG